MVWLWVIVAILGINLLFFLIRFFVRHNPEGKQQAPWKDNEADLIKNGILPATIVYKKGKGRSIADPDDE